MIISSAYNYEGAHSDEPRWDMQTAIPNFTYSRYVSVTGLYYSLTYGMAALFAGMISDNLQRKALLIVVVVGWNLTSVVIAVANKFTLVACMRIVFGLFSAFSSPIAYSLISDYFPPLKRTLANACFTAAAFFGISFAVLSNILVGTIGWRATYIFCAIYGFIAIGIVACVVREPERGRFDPKKEEIQEIIDQDEAMPFEDSQVQEPKKDFVSIVKSVGVGMKLLITNSCTRWLLIGNLTLSVN